MVTADSVLNKKVTNYNKNCRSNVKSLMEMENQ